MYPPSIRHLVLILGDQLDLDSSAFDDFDPAQDVVWMAEVREESDHVPSGKPRIALFLAAMRHFASALETRGWTVRYQRIDAPDASPTLAAALDEAVRACRPAGLVMVEAGDWRVAQALEVTAARLGLPLDIRIDRHFLSTLDEFRAHARGRKQLRMEYWYREVRRRTGYLMEHGEPVGGQWNYDGENREAFGPGGPGAVPEPSRFAPDALTREVLDTVDRLFPDRPGDLSAFSWPVNRDQAREALGRFIRERLPGFGRHQDAMWPGQPWLWHAHLSAAMNLKLLHPREVCDAAEQAWREGHAPLASVEGFIRQILGWREYVRGIYHLGGPGYENLNELGANHPLPAFYWTGKTDMACLSDTLGQTLDLGYAHHIQRLMVTGLYALLLGVDPHAIHEWFLAVHVDAVAWVELPNTLGMSQFADGGRMASKPYVASGRYIERMSGYCGTCRYRPERRVGADACPFTTLYWAFLDQHEERLARNPRMVIQVRNLARLDATERTAIREAAGRIRAGDGAPQPADPHGA
ncbi:MAG: cryptochrome/photolyase family protein [Candidatus Sericytochromatia bacterium]|nr:cryptochrome/photolyase family protein [Candidatus Sericytochromatia bacterium]